MLVEFVFPVEQNRALVTVDVNAVVGELISSGIGKQQH
jgi:hypothetical protein